MATALGVSIGPSGRASAYAASWLDGCAALVVSDERGGLEKTPGSIRLSGPAEADRTGSMRLFGWADAWDKQMSGALIFFFFHWTYGAIDPPLKTVN